MNIEDVLCDYKNEHVAFFGRVEVNKEVKSILMCNISSFI